MPVNFSDDMHMKLSQVKISCLPVGMFPQFLNRQVGIDDWLKAGSEMNLDGVDISCQFFNGHVPAMVEPEIKQIKSMDIPIVMVVAYSDFTQKIEQQILREQAYICRDIALASEYGAKYVRVLAGQQREGLSIEQGVEIAAKNLIQIAEIARKFGVTLVYENDLNPSGWINPDFSSLADVFPMMVDKLRGSPVRVNFDTANVVACGKDVVVELARVIDMVATLHVADTATADKLTPTSVGTGLVPLADTFSFLKENSFSGYLCIEAGVETTFDQIRNTVERVRNIWEKA